MLNIKDKKQSSGNIRREFLDYFGKLKHEIFPSISLIPDDPTLLFTSAGMVQFKRMFIDKKTSRIDRAASSQRCFRTSDIERVGNTLRHLTFFEMLGNFSFGDYFKKEAIGWAWDFLVNRMGLARERLYVSVYNEDDEAFGIWRNIVGEDRIIRLGKETNFWEMGVEGPCGPCSEIIFDMGKEMACNKEGCGPGCDCDRWLEIWNLVFTQFNKNADGILKPLPQKNIDTGMGLERLVLAVQEVKSTFDTDLFFPLIEYCSGILGFEYGKEEKTDRSLRIIADHSRSVAFLISDGCLPSNEGRGYVLRRVLRRAVRHGRLAGMKDPFIYKMVCNVAEIMKEAYPQVYSRRNNISGIVKVEEEKFLTTLDAGEELLEKIISDSISKGVIPGSDVFFLYDTYGFPSDLTREIALERGLDIDMEGFENAMEKQRLQARKNWKGSGASEKGDYGQILGKTGEIIFRGYEQNELVSKLVLIRDMKEGTVCDEACEGQDIEFVLNETPFYGESGGQIGDKGSVGKGKGFKDGLIDVNDTLRPVNGLIIHRGKVVRGRFITGDVVEAKIDIKRRADIKRHHTGTHLLQAALRDILGKHVEQSGSLVTDQRFRFDYTHSKPLDKRQIYRIEDIVNENIRANHSVLTRQLSLSEAKQMGAMAFFGEKYSDQVRVVMVTSEGWSAPPDAVSLEVCGGTHCANTGEIGLFKILSETGIASGVRRIEAVCGYPAIGKIRTEEENIISISQLLKTSPDSIVLKIEKIMQELKDKDQQINTIRAGIAGTKAEDLLDNVEVKNGVKMLVTEIKGADRKMLLNYADELKKKIVSGVIVLGSEGEKEAIVLSVVTQDLAGKFHAGNIIKAVSEILNGRGGGKPSLAQGGGKDKDKLNEALQKARIMLGLRN